MNIRLIIVLLLLNTSVFAQLHTYKWTNGNKKAEGVVKDGLEQEKPSLPDSWRRVPLMEIKLWTFIMSGNEKPLTTRRN